MNIELCTIKDITKDGFFFESRYEIFSQRLGWSVFVDDGKEYDQYDNDNATYIIISEGDETLASVRLIETKHPHLLTGSFHNYFLCKSHSTIEATRFFVRKKIASSKEPICQILLIAMIEYCMITGHSSIMAIVGSGMSKVLDRYKWPHEIIEECFIEDKIAYLINLPVTREILLNIKDNASIDHHKQFISTVKKNHKVLL
ncbi:acyl-homoserine-lactone synthase [Klebsiella sp. BIGb0407]|uniref:acyl-homoserine-lactone synthase n=1 Tax=Klebsiella sp. BIGb0407 TaxID=2940603 RepID=UPI002169D303|nr:acyl-homoserine-lactone synthase [Klebsiella sp. BIGb0407]MCS3433519.1 acyl homoserine lactone synthase [Klebsiella sp. BIGb0407]